MIAQMPIASDLRTGTQVQSSHIVYNVYIHVLLRGQLHWNFLYCAGGFCPRWEGPRLLGQAVEPHCVEMLACFFSIGSLSTVCGQFVVAVRKARERARQE